MKIKEQFLKRIDKTGSAHPCQDLNLCADILEIVAIESTMWVQDNAENIPTLIIELSRVLRERAKELGTEMDNELDKAIEERIKEYESK